MSFEFSPETLILGAQREIAEKQARIAELQIIISQSEFEIQEVGKGVKRCRPCTRFIGNGICAQGGGCSTIFTPEQKTIQDNNARLRTIIRNSNTELTTLEAEIKIREEQIIPLLDEVNVRDGVINFDEHGNLISDGTPTTVEPPKVLIDEGGLVFDVPTPEQQQQAIPSENNNDILKILLLAGIVFL